MFDIHSTTSNKVPSLPVKCWNETTTTTENHNIFSYGSSHHHTVSTADILLSLRSSLPAAAMQDV